MQPLNLSAPKHLRHYKLFRELITQLPFYKLIFTLAVLPLSLFEDGEFHD